VKHVSVTLTYVTSSLAAVAFEQPERMGILWIAKSLIQNHETFNAADYSNGDLMEVEIPAWVAEKKGLDPYCEEIEE